MKSNIKIFMCCHKGYDIIPPCAVPIQGGRAINPHIEGIMGDDTGDNISEKNRDYCELTVQYYAWKNEKLDAYGFCHYRRFFCFNDNVTKPYLAFDKISEKQQKKYLGTEDEIAKIIAQTDIVIPYSEKYDVSVREYYKTTANPNETDSDLNLFVDIISERYPFLSSHAEKYLSGNRQYFCNMFIMKAAYFNEYCDMLFSVLDEFDRRKADSDAPKTTRTNGYLAERFVGIYLEYAKSKGAKIKHVARIDTKCTLKKRLLYFLLPPESKIRFLVKKLTKAKNK